MRLGQGDEPLPGVLLGLQLTVEPVPRQQRRAHHPAPARAVLLGHGHQPLQHVGLGAVGEQRAQPVGLGDDHGRRAHGQPPRVDGVLHRRVGRLAERLRHRDHLLRPAGAGRGGVVTHPLGHGHHRRPAGCLAAAHRLPHDSYPRGVTRQTQLIDVAEQSVQPCRAATGRRLPQRGVETAERLARRGNPLASLLKAQAPLHEDNHRGEHRQRTEVRNQRIPLSGIRIRLHNGQTIASLSLSPVDGGTPPTAPVDKPVNTATAAADPRA